MVTTLVAIFVLHFTIRHGSTNYVSDTIENDIQAYYGKLSKYPSKIATIEHSITYPLEEYKMYLYIYTHHEKLSLNSSYSRPKYGQLRNENLRIPLLKGRYRNSWCHLEEGGKVCNCSGKTIVRDFLPRDFSFSFFSCLKNCSQKGSLLGMHFNVSIYDQSNETRCIDVSGSKIVECLKHYSHTAVLTWLTNTDFMSSLATLRLADIYFQLVDTRCHKYVFLFVCYTFLPKCDRVSEQIIPPCKEACSETTEACVTPEYIERAVNALKFSRLYNWYNILKTWNGKDPMFNCSYLPSKDSPIPCMYKPVTCIAPNSSEETISPGTININVSFPVHSTLDYTCKDETYIMEGNQSVTCLYSGEWSHQPRCVKPTSLSHNSFLAFLFLFVIPLLVGIIFIRKRRFRKHTQLSPAWRCKTYDAYVCYDFDGDSDYVTDIVLPTLEEIYDPPFKLCFHMRDFQPGQLIKGNIQEAIQTVTVQLLSCLKISSIVFGVEKSSKTVILRI